ncbi:MAG: branched-chain amino acid ABC transporter permease [Methylobacteriaceae bacterium]|nr:branched-chain amino acid ABC transporter permease [Methylobacteriaceae bacterium]
MAEAALAPATPAPAAGRTRTMLALVMLAAALLALPFVATALGDSSIITLATRIVILAIAAASLNLALGYGGLVSFGHAAYYGLGGYVVGILYASLREPMFGVLPATDQLLVTLPLAVIVGGVAALILGAMSLRTSGVQFIMITLAFAQMLFFLFVSLKAYGGDDGLSIRRRNALPFLNTRDETTFYFVCLTVAALYFALLRRVVGSRFGLVLGGIRQSERRMEALGIRTYRYKLVAFVISGMGCALAGALMANYARFVSPDMLHWTQSGEFMIMVILGGVGTWLGPAVGAAILILLETVLAAWTEHWQVVLGPLLVLIVLFGRSAVERVAARIAGRRS